MAHYINIDHANNKIYDKDEVVFSKKNLLQKFEEFVGVCGYQVTWINNKRAPYELQISNGIKEYTLILYLKNITGAGWFDKPHIKRVQVTNVRNDDMSKYIDTTSNQTIDINASNIHAGLWTKREESFIYGNLSDSNSEYKCIKFGDEKNELVDLFVVTSNGKFHHTQFKDEKIKKKKELYIKSIRNLFE